MKKEELELGMVFTFGERTDIEYVVTGIYPESATMERINHRMKGSNRHGCGYGWFENPDTTLRRKMDDKELLRYQTADPVCDLEPGIYRLNKNIVDMNFKTLAGAGEIINLTQAVCEENPYGSKYCLKITFRRFGYAQDTTATFYENTKIGCIHLFWRIFKKININQ